MADLAETSPLDVFKAPRAAATKDDIAFIVQQIFNDEHLNLKSVLNGDQIAHIARASAYAAKFKCKPMEDLVKLLLQLKVSDDGRGRDDLVKALNTALALEEHTPRSFADRILGTRR